MQICLLRHGKTVLSGKYCGAGDVALAEEGCRQIVEIAPLVKTLGANHCFLSPMLRCRHSFELLDLRQSFSVMDDLREIDFGDWEGMGFDEISNKYPEKVAQWIEMKEHFTFPQGEKILDFSARIGGCIKKITASGYDKVLVVCHGGVIRHALCHLLGLHCSKADCFEIGEGSLSMVTYDSGYSVLQKINLSG